MARSKHQTVQMNETSLSCDSLQIYWSDVDHGDWNACAEALDVWGRCYFDWKELFLLDLGHAVIHSNTQNQISQPGVWALSQLDVAVSSDSPAMMKKAPSEHVPVFINRLLNGYVERLYLITENIQYSELYCIETTRESWNDHFFRSSCLISLPTMLFWQWCSGITASRQRCSSALELYPAHHSLSHSRSFFISLTASLLHLANQILCAIEHTIESRSLLNIVSTSGSGKRENTRPWRTSANVSPES